jgi:hypothetical protein
VLEVIVVKDFRRWAAERRGRGFVKEGVEKSRFLRVE